MRRYGCIPGRKEPQLHGHVQLPSAGSKPVLESQGADEHDFVVAGGLALLHARPRRYLQGRCRRYSKKYLAEHESDIIIHKAAKKAFDELGLKKLPTVKSLQAEYAELLAGKKEAYAEYHSAQKEMRELLIHRQNIVQFLSLDTPAVQKEKEHDRG